MSGGDKAPGTAHCAMGLSQFSQWWGFGFHVGFYFGDVDAYFLGYSVFMLTFASRVKPAPGKCGCDSLLPPRRGSSQLLPTAAAVAKAVVASRLSNGGRDTSARGAGRLLAMVFMVFNTTGLIATESLGPSPTWVDPGVEELSVVELAREMESGRLTSERVVQAYLARIESIDRNGPALRSVISTLPEALTVARQLDAERAAGLRRGPWHGIPILIKDNIEAAGPVPTTAGSTALLANVTIAVGQTRGETCLPLPPPRRWQRRWLASAGARRMSPPRPLLVPRRARGPRPALPC